MMKKFKNLEEIEEKILKYSNSLNNDYLNMDKYIENFENLYYFENGDLYIGILKENYFEIFFYLMKKNKLNIKGNFVTEVVGKNPEIEPLLEIGFKKYITRVRFRLKNKLDFISDRVKIVKDFEFVKSGINSFDKISGNIQSDEEIQKSIDGDNVLGINGIGFLQFSIGKYDQTIEHLYVDKNHRKNKIADEILKHYISNYTIRKRSTVWCNEGSFVERLYKGNGFVKDGMKSVVLINNNLK